MDDINTVRVTDHALERFGQWIGMSHLPEHILERVDGNTKMLMEEIGAALENPHWEHVTKFTQHAMDTNMVEKVIYLVDLKNMFYDEEKKDYWAYFYALVEEVSDGWLVSTIMPNGFVIRSTATGKFRRVA